MLLFPAKRTWSNVIAGEPQRCIAVIRRWRDALGLTVVSGTFYCGGMPQEMARRNIHRCATEVMPPCGAGRGSRPVDAYGLQTARHLPELNTPAVST